MTLALRYSGRVITRRLYYKVKPHLPWRLRMAVRRYLARRKRPAFAASWPIDTAAGHVPLGWPGWPEAREFAFLVTHDVEGPEGLAKCRRLADLEMQLGFRSSFNFVPEGTYQVTYDMRSALAADGFEIGIHDLHHDGKLYASRQRFRENAAKINRYAREWGAAGFRSGFMLHNLDWLHELELDYDASTFDTDPFEPQPDGVGTIFPFLWQGGAGRRGYVELPYTLPQDSTLFLLLRETSPDIWLRKLDWIADCGGMALVNVHPDYLRFPGEKAGARTFPVEHYLELLKHVRDRHAGRFWHALPRDVARYVKAHSAGVRSLGPSYLFPQRADRLEFGAQAAAAT
jgi:hypothetical protein